MVSTLTAWKNAKFTIRKTFFVKTIYKRDEFSLVKRWFDGKFAKKTVAVKSRNFHSVTLVIFLQKFRENNFFHKQIRKQIDYTKYFISESKFTLWKLRDFTAMVFSQKYRQINVLLKNFTINWFGGKKLRSSEFLVSSHCVFKPLSNCQINFCIQLVWS